MLNVEVAASWTPARAVPLAPARARWDSVAQVELVTAAGWLDGVEADAAVTARWGSAAEADVLAATSWGEGVGNDAASASAWNAVERRDLSVFMTWDRTIRAQDVRLRLIYNPLPPYKDAATGLDWFRCDEFGQRHDAAAERLASLYVPGRVAEFTFAGNRYVPSTVPMAWFDFRYSPPAYAIQPVDAGTGSRFSQADILDATRISPWGWGTPLDPVPTGIVYPDYPGPVVVIDPPEEPEILETYMIANTVTLAVLPSATPLDAMNIRLSLDIDSFAWSFSAELLGRTSLNLVMPDGNGPKTVELTINGHSWRFLVERWSGNGKHPAERFSITGASRTQLLAAPYAPKRSAVNASQLNARQVVDDQLLNTGFSATWDIVALGPPDWTLPAGAFSYQDQTPMEVIHRLAEVVGGVVRPDQAGDGLTVLPRYREATWFWRDAVPDCIVAGEIVAEWGSEWSPQPQWNFVYVSGTNYGVGVQVRRAGTAGDEPAADVMDDWMTGPDAARSRGICELSKGGNQSIETRRIPLFHKGGSPPGLVLPAMLVECRDGDTPWRGLCLGTEVSASGVGSCEVWQTLKIERHWSN